MDPRQVLTQWNYTASTGGPKIFADVPLLFVDALFNNEYLATARVQPTQIRPISSLQIDILLPYNRTVTNRKPSVAISQPSVEVKLTMLDDLDINPDLFVPLPTGTIFDKFVSLYLR